MARTPRPRKTDLATRSGTRGCPNVHLLHGSSGENGQPAAVAGRIADPRKWLLPVRPGTGSATDGTRFLIGTREHRSLRGRLSAGTVARRRIVGQVALPFVHGR
ncbi:hypothetical protein BN6_53920 [Saccharothrix espanaensis DSM 44229]|uniref:Uncharacterized protein n=1 Tax=Saccharothrix espanaensis (strain ATCC 51144 / DSM 44229 / JCM 9112 / NBRC 15066 / NRRL 15764) TaxID=1179773 RepID=K0K2Y3_SACES|nr:hypothetical protein BN6_53920 [Saccharothrix espanaensis DSM 44229]